MSILISGPVVLPDGSVTAVKIDSGAAPDGHVLTADGVGGADFDELPAAGGGLLASGATVGATGQVQVFTNGILTGDAATSLQPGTVVAAGDIDVSGTSLGTHAFADEQQLIAIDVGSGYASFDARPQLKDADNRTHFVGYQSRPVIDTTGGEITDYMDGFNVAMTHAGAHPIASMSAFRVLPPTVSGAGTIATQYGLKIGALTQAAINYGIYIAQNGGSDYGLYNLGNTHLGAVTTITPYLNLLTPNVAQDYAPLRLFGIGHGVGDETRVAWYESTALEYALGHIGVAFSTSSAHSSMRFATRVSGVATERFVIDENAISLVNPAITTSTTILVLNPSSATAGSESRIQFSAASVAQGYIGVAFQTGSTDGYIAFATRLASTVAEKMRLDKDGKLGIGTMVPTAALHLPASTTARASLRIPAGTAPAAPNAGDVWVEGIVLKFFDGTITKELAFV